MQAFKKIRDEIKTMGDLFNIEPVLILHVTGVFMASIITTDFLYYEACRVDIQQSPRYCHANKTKDELTAEIVTDINIWKQIIDNAFPVLFVLSLGAWSDVYGRKFPLLLVLAGYVLRDIGLLFSVHFSGTPASIVALVASLPTALTGGRTVMSMALHAYVVDTTSIGQRTMKTGVVSVIRTFSQSLGSALGVWMKKGGLHYNVIFGVSGLLDLAAFFYTLLLIKNTNGETYNRRIREKEEAKQTTDAVQGDTKKKNKKWKNISWNMVRAFFSLRNVIESGKTVFKKREGHFRLELILIMVALTFAMASVQGEETVLQQFVYKQIGWSTEDYGYYKIFSAIVSFLGGVISLGVFVKVLGLSDPCLGILACSSHICGSLIYSFADRGWLMYAGTVVVIHGAMGIATNSMLSKIVPRDEIGKVYSWVGIIEALSRLSVDPIYAAIFRLTLNSFHGAFFLVSVGLTLPPLIIFLIFPCKFNLPNEGQDESEKTKEIDQH